MATRAEVEAAKQQVQEAQSGIRESRSQISETEQNISRELRKLKPKKRIPFTPRKERYVRQKYKKGGCSRMNVVLKILNFKYWWDEIPALVYPR